MEYKSVVIYQFIVVFQSWSHVWLFVTLWSAAGKASLLQCPWVCLIHIQWWASLVAQMVKNLLVMQQTWVQSLAEEDPLEKEMATHSRILAWKIPWREEPSRATVHRVTESDMTEKTEHTHDYMSIESVRSSSHIFLCGSLLLLHWIFSSIRIFSNESALYIRWPKYGASVSASVLHMNTQGLLPLGLTGLISLLSKGLSPGP